VIRFGAIVSVVTVAIGLLVAGAVSGDLALVYVSIGLAALALLMLIVGVAIWRDQVFGPTTSAAQAAGAGPASRVAEVTGSAGPAGNSAAPDRPASDRTVAEQLTADRMAAERATAERAAAERAAAERAEADRAEADRAAQERAERKRTAAGPGSRPGGDDRGSSRSSWPGPQSRSAATAQTAVQHVPAGQSTPAGLSTQAGQAPPAGPDAPAGKPASTEGPQPERSRPGWTLRLPDDRPAPEPAASGPAVTSPAAGAAPAAAEPAAPGPSAPKSARAVPPRSMRAGPQPATAQTPEPTAAREQSSADPAGAALPLLPNAVPPPAHGDESPVEAASYLAADDPTRLARRRDSAAEMLAPASGSAALPSRPAPAGRSTTRGSDLFTPARPATSPGGDLGTLPPPGRPSPADPLTGPAPAPSPGSGRTRLQKEAEAAAAAKAAAAPSAGATSTGATVAADLPKAASAPAAEAVSSKAATARPADREAAPAPEPAPAPPPAAAPAPTVVADSPAATDEAAATVSVVPGIARYHMTDCILIRFLSAEDLQTMTRQAAEASGCVPCRACRPEKSAADA
jgi:hypothetical protein